MLRVKITFIHILTPFTEGERKQLYDIQQDYVRAIRSLLYYSWLVFFIF